MQYTIFKSGFEEDRRNSFQTIPFRVIFYGVWKSRWQMAVISVRILDGPEDAARPEGRQAGIQEKECLGETFLKSDAPCSKACPRPDPCSGLILPRRSGAKAGFIPSKPVFCCKKEMKQNVLTKN